MGRRMDGWIDVQAGMETRSQQVRGETGESSFSKSSQAVCRIRLVVLEARCPSFHPNSSRASLPVSDLTESSRFCSETFTLLPFLGLVLVFNCGKVLEGHLPRVWVQLILAGR